MLESIEPLPTIQEAMQALMRDTLHIVRCRGLWLTWLMSSFSLLLRRLARLAAEQFILLLRR